MVLGFNEGEGADPVPWVVLSPAEDLLSDAMVADMSEQKNKAKCLAGSFD
jgi:hypothetical protein